MVLKISFIKGSRGSVIWWFTVIMGMIVGAFFFMMAYRYTGSQVVILQVESIKALTQGINSFISIAIGSPSEMEQMFMLPSTGKGGYNITIRDDLNTPIDEDGFYTELPKKLIEIQLTGSNEDTPAGKPLSSRNIISHRIRFPDFDKISIKKFSMANTFSAISMTTNVVLVYTPLQIILLPDCINPDDGNADNNAMHTQQLKLIEKIVDSLSNYDKIVVPGDREYLFLTQKKKFKLGYAFDMDLLRQSHKGCGKNIIETLITYLPNIYFSDHKAKKVAIVISTQGYSGDPHKEGTDAYNLKQKISTSIDRLHRDDVIILEKKHSGDDHPCPYEKTLNIKTIDKNWEDWEGKFVFCPSQTPYPLLEYIISKEGPIDAASYQYTQLHSYVKHSLGKAKILRKIFCPGGAGSKCNCPLVGKSEYDVLGEVVKNIETLETKLKSYRTRDELLDAIGKGGTFYDDKYCKLMVDQDKSVGGNCEIHQLMKNQLSSSQSALLECNLPEV